MSQTLGRAINFLLFAATSPLAAQQPGTRQLKDEVLQEVVSLQKLSQEITDMAFSFGELGFREHSTVKYLTDVLRREGFRITTGCAGMPTS